MIYGYCRVSTLAQERDGHTLAVQRQQLENAGAERIYSDAFSGTRSDRPELQELLKALQRNDTLIVTKIDRLGRSVRQVNSLISELLDKGITVHVLNMGVMDTSPTGQLMQTMMLAFAEFERDMIVQRTQEGKATAKQKPGYRAGRRPKYIPEQISHAMKLLEEHSYSQVAKMTGISKSTLIRAHRRWQTENTSC